MWQNHAHNVGDKAPLPQPRKQTKSKPKPPPNLPTPSTTGAPVPIDPAVIPPSPSKRKLNNANKTAATPRSIINQEPPTSLKQMLQKKAEAKQAEEEAANAAAKEEEKNNEDNDASDRLLSAPTLAEIPERKVKKLVERIRCQGYLSKQGHHWNSWKRRWFVMKLTSLEFYKRRPKKDADKPSKPQGAISLASINKIQRDLSKYPQPYSFQMICKDRVFAVQADSRSDMEMWIDEINDAVRAIKLGVQSGTLQLGAFASKTVARRATMAGTTAEQASLKTMNFSEEFMKIRNAPKAESSSDKKTARASRSSVIGLYGLEKPNVSPKFEEKPADGDEPKVSPGKDEAGTGAGAPISEKVAEAGEVGVSTGAQDGEEDTASTDKRSFLKTLSAVSTVRGQEKAGGAEDEKAQGPTSYDRPGRIPSVALDEAPVLNGYRKAVPDINVDFEVDIGMSLLQKREDGLVESTLTLEALSESTRIGLYFGADWCPPCHAFLPRLVDYYTRLRRDGKDIEIVFVSNDSNAAEFNNYYTYNMPWLAMPFSEDVRRYKLAERLGVSSVPNLVFLDGTGQVLAVDGLDLVLNDTDGGLLFRMRAPNASPPKASPPVGSIYGTPTMANGLSSRNRTSPPSKPSLHGWRESNIVGNSPMGNTAAAQQASGMRNVVGNPGDVPLPSLPRPPEGPGNAAVLASSSSLSKKRTPKRSEAYRRRLIKEKQMRLKMTPRVLAQHVMWLDTLQVSPVPIGDLYRELRSGVLLCGIVQVLVPEAEFKSINPRPRTMRPAINNIEKALSIIWRKGRPNARRMPTAKEIFEAKSERIGWLIREVFDCFVMREMRVPSRCSKMFQWFQDILGAYGRSLRPRTVNAPFRGEAFEKSLWEDFHDGTNLACVLHYFCGSIPYQTFPGVNLKYVYEKPEQAAQFESNVTYVFEMLSHLSIPLVWSTSDFIAFPDESFMLWQIHAVFLALAGLDCALPEIAFAEYSPDVKKEGITVDAFGKPVIVNVSFRTKGSSGKDAGYSNAGNDLQYPGVGVGQSAYGSPGIGRKKKWNNSTLSPELSHKERGPPVVWDSGIRGKGEGYPSSYGSSMKSSPQDNSRSFAAMEIERLRRLELQSNQSGRHPEPTAPEMATGFSNSPPTSTIPFSFKTQLKDLEEEKEMLIEAEKIAVRTGPSSVKEIDRAVQLREKRLMLQEEIRRITEMIREDMRTRGSPMSRMGSSANRRATGGSQPPAASVLAPPPGSSPRLPATFSPRAPPLSPRSPTAAEDLEARRKMALSWLRNPHMVDIEFSTGSFLKDQKFTATEDESGATIFIWTGPGFAEGETGYLPAKEVVDVTTNKGGISLNVDQGSGTGGTISVILRVQDQGDHLRMLANLNTIL
jgi:thiol-disulfide isomerase/thioredoxin